MNENLDPTNHNFSPEELDIDRALRPISFGDFAGQDQILENLKVFVEAANLRGEALVRCWYKNYFRPRFR